MIKRTTIALFPLALLLALPAAAQDWAGRGRLQGSVSDPEGNPIAGAQVTLYKREPGNGPPSFETNKKGRWSYLGLGQGQWNVVIEYPGFVTSEGTISVNEFGTNKPVKVEIRPIPEAELQADAAAAAVRELDRGNELMAQGKFAEARAIYQAALESLDEQYHHLVKIGIANTHLSEGNAAQAVTVLEPLVAEFSGEMQLQHTLARAYYQSGQADKSITMLEAIVAGDPEDVDTLRLLIDLLVQADREVEAQAYMEKLPEGETLSADTVLNTGIKLYNNGDLDGALAQFDRAVEENPDMPEAYYFRGLVNIGKEQNEAAVADLKRFVELAPDHAQAEEARQFLSYLEGE